MTLAGMAPNPEVEVPDKAPTPKPLRPAPRKKEAARKPAMTSGKAWASVDAAPTWKT